MSAVLGVCSWSLQPRTPAELAARARRAGLAWVQLALDPLRRGDWPVEETAAALREAGVGIRSGMMGTRGEDYTTLASIRATGGFRPDIHWEENLAAATANAALARCLGLDLVSFHAGFLPEDRRDPERGRLVGRLREVCRRFADQGVRAALETGQENAATLLEVLAELDQPQAGVNFDPANLLLYGMGDPVEALRALAPRVLQIHVKDARPPRRPGEWGEEVRAGTGAVDWPAFFGVLSSAGLEVDLMIEREAGPDRVADIAAARGLVEARLAAAGRGTR